MSRPADVARRFKHGPIQPANDARPAEPLDRPTVALILFTTLYFAGQLLRGAFA